MSGPGVARNWTAEDAARADADLAGADALEVLRWARAQFGDGLVVASSMGDEVLVHLASRAGAEAAPVHVVFLDTGFHFAETLGTRDVYAAEPGLSVRTVQPLLTVAEQAERHGPALHDRDPDRCCALRKVEPLERALAPYRAWATGMRREDAATRADLPVVGWDAKRGKVKLNPLAAWTQADVDAYAAEHRVFLNPLREAGYSSIGCAPCTRPTRAGEDPRAGRWSGSAKTECGLHT
jgi:phosphoadenosine phosphosulfate reductase